MTFRVAILTISDRAAQGVYQDDSGPLLQKLISELTPWIISDFKTVPDDRQLISEQLIAWCELSVNLIITTGGTGFGPRDVTPEATKSVIERDAPGIAEAIRQESLKITAHAMLSRAAAGIRGRTLIINFPGNPKAVKESLNFILPVLPHAINLLSGSTEAESGHRVV